MQTSPDNSATPSRLASVQEGCCLAVEDAITNLCAKLEPYKEAQQKKDRATWKTWPEFLERCANTSEMQATGVCQSFGFFYHIYGAACSTVEIQLRSRAPINPVCTPERTVRAG